MEAASPSEGTSRKIQSLVRQLRDLASQLLTIHDVAKKYTNYNKLRARRALPNAGADTPATPSRRSSTKRKRDDVGVSQPATSSDQRPLEHDSQGAFAPATKTSNLARDHPAELDPYDSPRPSQTTPTAVRTTIGPTPQRNGFALGLFDLMTPTKAIPTVKRAAEEGPTQVSLLQATPSKKLRTTPQSANKQHLETANTIAMATPVQVCVTPVKQSGSHAKHSRTPPSTARKEFLSAFLMTPMARRLRNQPSGDPFMDRNVATPSSRKRGTAAARLGLAKVAENIEDKENAAEMDSSAEPHISLSPVKVRLPPKPIGRPLSALVRGLKEMEEERMDEELDVLRELEAEEDQGPPQRPQKPRKVGLEAARDVETDVEQNKKDGDDLAEAEVDKPKRAWKKKGQKRTTRNVRIQPSTAKWKPEPEWKGGMDSASENEEKGNDQEMPDDDDSHSGSDNKLDNREDSIARGKGPKKKEEKKKRRPPKKIAPTAHANFRALKIKTKNSKAKKGRFGRRR